MGYYILGSTTDDITALSCSPVTAADQYCILNKSASGELTPIKCSPVSAENQYCILGQTTDPKLTPVKLEEVGGNLFLTLRPIISGESSSSESDYQVLPDTQVAVSDTFTPQTFISSFEGNSYDLFYDDDGYIYVYVIDSAHKIYKYTGFDWELYVEFPDFSSLVPNFTSTGLMCLNKSSGNFIVTINRSIVGRVIYEYDLIADTWTNLGIIDGAVLEVKYNPYDEHIYFVGTFDNAGGVSAKSIVKWDGSNFTEMYGGFSSYYSGTGLTVWTIEWDEDNVYIAPDSTRFYIDGGGSTVYTYGIIYKNKSSSGDFIQYLTDWDLYWNQDFSTLTKIGSYIYTSGQIRTSPTYIRGFFRFSGNSYTRLIEDITTHYIGHNSADGLMYTYTAYNPFPNKITEINMSTLATREVPIEYGDESERVNTIRDSIYLENTAYEFDESSSGV